MGVCVCVWWGARVREPCGQQLQWLASVDVLLGGELDVLEPVHLDELRDSLGRHNPLGEIALGAHLPTPHTLLRFC
jgi:hypothetical protein